jgi:hypothetical protein
LPSTVSIGATAVALPGAAVSTGFFSTIGNTAAPAVTGSFAPGPPVTFSSVLVLISPAPAASISFLNFSLASTFAKDLATCMSA